MGRYYWQISILSKWLQWLNMEEDPSVVDAEILDHVSDPLPLPLDSPTRTPVSDSIVSESPQFSFTTNNSSDFTSPVSWHVKDCILKSTSAVMDAATLRNGPFFEIVHNSVKQIQSALRNELNFNL